MNNKPDGHSEIRINPRLLRRGLAVAVVVLLALGALAYVLYPLGESISSGGLVEIGKRLDMDHEINVPTWFSSSLLLVCSLLLGTIALTKWSSGDRFSWHWALLALVFLLMSMDETANMHELLIVPIRRRLGLGGFLYFAWVIPGAIAVASMGLAYLKFLWNLDARTRWQFIYAGCVYVGGAMGMELVGGAMADWYGFESIRYITVMMAEEALEMLGLILFLTALLGYIDRNLGGGFRFSVFSVR